MKRFCGLIYRVAGIRIADTKRVLVTNRMRPLRLKGGRIVHQIGLPYHWSSKGLVRGDAANDLIGFVADPVYAPALVGYLGDPASVLASAAAGALVGWFPLGPGEAYWPSYNNDAGYIRAVNTGIVADPGNLGARPSGDAASANLNFANRRFATVVPQQVFATAQRVGRAALPVAAAAALHAAVTAQAPQFHPANGHGRPMVVVVAGHRGLPVGRLGWAARSAKM